MADSLQKLIFIHPSDELYGADRMLLEMLEAVGDAAEVEVWLPNDLAHPKSSLCAELARRGIRAQHLDLPIMRRAYQNPRGLIKTARRWLRLTRTLRGARPDTVYCTTSAAFLGAPAARAARVPSVIGHFQEIWSVRDRYLLGGPARAPHQLLAISQAVADALPRAVRRHTIVVPNGTPDPGTVQPMRTVGELQFLVASRWNGWKGHQTLFEAWNVAGAPGHLTVLGGPPMSGRSTDVWALTAALDHPGSVTIVGEVTDPSSYLAASDVVLVPSDQPEPFGLVAIEAFARGRPVIGTDAGGLRDIVTSGRNGWLFPPLDVAALVDIFGHLTRESVTAAGRDARSTYEARFTDAEFARKWRSVVFATDPPGNLDGPSR